MKSSLIFFLFISLALAACNTTGSEPPRLDIPGKIVFSAKDDNGISQIYTMQANGSDLRQITHFKKGGAGNPTWSPDGRHIAFENGSGATTLGSYLYLIDADGSNMRPLKRYKRPSPRALIGEDPAWSPDGTKIAFEVCTNCEIGGENYEISYVEVAGEDFDPAQLHAVTSSPYSDMFPTWSPDAKKLLSVPTGPILMLIHFGFVKIYTWLIQMVPMYNA